VQIAKDSFRTRDEGMVALVLRDHNGVALRTIRLSVTVEHN
jgi:hypothetical protein